MVNNGRKSTSFGGPSKFAATIVGVLVQLWATLDAVPILEAIVAVTVNFLAGTFTYCTRVGSRGIGALISAVTLHKNKSKLIVDIITSQGSRHSEINPCFMTHSLVPSSCHISSAPWLCSP